MAYAKEPLSEHEFSFISIVPSPLRVALPASHPLAKKKQLSLQDLAAQDLEIVAPSIAGSEDALILDSFAGSGTTAHAVLNMNKADGGHRKFILVEMGDYADTITAERVKRVIKGYGEGKNAVEGTSGNFSYYELGEPLLLPSGNLNEKVGTEKIRDYIWYTETKKPLPDHKNSNPYFLGENNHTAYYFYYEPDQMCVLDYAFLSTIPEKAENYLIYADRCALSESDLLRFGITFKKIPRDIARV